MNYGEIITSAFRITLSNRYLWFLGFFVGLGSGGGDFGEQSSAEIASIAAVQQGTFDNALLIVGQVVLGLLILLVFFALYVVSQGGLTESVAAIDRGEERRFSSTWRDGARNFWPVLWQILLFVGIVLGLLLAVGMPVALLVAAVIVAVLVVIALLVVVFVLLAIVRQFARRELVVRGEGVVGSVGSGYRLLRRNFGRSLPVWLIQLGLMLAAGIALLIVALAVLGTFNHSYWTLAYLRLTNQGGTTLT